MEEKKTSWYKNTLWAVFSLGNFGNYVFGRSDNKKSLKYSFSNINFQRGFTLIELLVTISLIGVLSAAVIAIIDPRTQIQKTNDAHRKSDLTQLQRALEIYYNDNGKYPVECATNQIQRLDTTCANFGEQWMPYIQLLPKDPADPGRKYRYISPSGNQSYYLYAGLERPDDSSACSGKCPSVPSSVDCGAGVICNYGATSSNVSR